MGGSMLIVTRSILQANKQICLCDWMPLGTLIIALVTHQCLASLTGCDIILTMKGVFSAVNLGTVPFYIL